MKYCTRGASGASGVTYVCVCAGGAIPSMRVVLHVYVCVCVCVCVCACLCMFVCALCVRG